MPELCILQITPEFNAGGVERTVLEVAEAIKHTGGRALIATQGGRLEAEALKLGAEIFHLPLASKNPFIIYKNAAHLSDLIRKEKVTILHSRSRAPAWSAYWAAKRTHTPLVTTYHGDYSAKSALKHYYNGIMVRANKVIANSNYIAQRIHAQYKLDPKTLIVIPRGVDLDRFDPDNIVPERISALRKTWGINASDNRQIILLPGRLTAWKGQEMAIDAAHILSKQSVPPFLLILAGDAQGRDNYQSLLEKRIENYGLKKTIHIVGHCEDMPAAYYLANIVAIPSMRPEAFGRVAVEAQAMGKPVIVSDHGGQCETVKKDITGFRIEPGDVNMMANALLTLLLGGQKMQSEMGKTAAKWARENFSKSRLQKDTLMVYQQILAR